MNGIELARAVTETFPTIPILFMSGNPAEMLPGEVPANAFVQKPFSLQLLAAAVLAAVVAL